MSQVYELKSGLLLKIGELEVTNRSLKREIQFLKENIQKPFKRKNTEDSDTPIESAMR